VSAPDLTQTRRFLSALAGGEPVTFQTFSDREELKVKRPDSTTKDPNAKIGHGTLERDEDAALLTHLNAKGAGVYVMVNAGDGKGRAAENVVKVRALFVDTDGAPLPTSTPLEPHLKVQSSPGKYYLYRLTEGLRLTDFTPMQAALANLYWTDPNVKDLPRAMRLPGFYHRKAEPVMVQLLNASDHAPYSRDEVLSAWPCLAEALERERSERAEWERKQREARERAEARRKSPPVGDAADRERERALKVLEGHCHTVENARPTTRNPTLCRAAYTLGGYVANGYLERYEVEDALLDAARVCGLPDTEAGELIPRAISKGMGKPLELENTLAFDELGCSSNKSPWVSQKTDLMNTSRTQIGNTWTNSVSPWGKTCR
jgi:hypothetical protein